MRANRTPVPHAVTPVLPSVATCSVRWEIPPRPPWHVPCSLCFSQASAWPGSAPHLPFLSGPDAYFRNCSRFGSDPEQASRASGARSNGCCDSIETVGSHFDLNLRSEPSEAETCPELLASSSPASLLLSRSSSCSQARLPCPSPRHQKSRELDSVPPQSAPESRRHPLGRSEKLLDLLPESWSIHLFQLREPWAAR